MEQRKKHRMIHRLPVFFLLLILLLSALTACLFPADEQPTDKKGLTLSYSYKEVEKGTSLDAALSDLSITRGGEPISLAEVSFSGTYDPMTRGEYPLLLTSGGYSSTLVLSVEAEGVTENAAFMTLDEYAEKSGLSVGIPQSGDVEVLVIPIGFTNRKYDGVDRLLETAFNGTPEETGWHSLRSYYEKSSFGALRLHATVLPTYQTGKRWKRSERSALDETYLFQALAYYDKEIDYSSFDQNGDGLIDCVYMIYLAPYDEDSDLWWAYENTVSSVWTYDSVRPEAYLWMSVEFFTDPISDHFGEGDDMGVSVNAETLIHETGHALGLDDYYDYENEEFGGLGYLNMMDGNQGDHDPFSKAILGWIHPTFVYAADYDALLSPYEKSGDAVIISKQGKNSYFQEYFIVCYYTPTDLFALKAEQGVGIFSCPGVLIYHVTADLKGRSAEDIIDIYQTNNGKTPRLISICEADDDDSVDSSFYAEDDDLFTEGSVFSPLWNDGTDAGFTLNVLSFDESGARIEIRVSAESD